MILKTTTTARPRKALFENIFICDDLDENLALDNHRFIFQTKCKIADKTLKAMGGFLKEFKATLVNLS